MVRWEVGIEVECRVNRLLINLFLSSHFDFVNFP